MRENKTLAMCDLRRRLRYVSERAIERLALCLWLGSWCWCWCWCWLCCWLSLTLT
ncbi:hypothetical protein K440DRAFT_615609 [Wilcoxina mikolae CBS 423.85]|nr:hypothetical protein K440DRAFT_615609 [Wilcoxina mikolae CBS 423.85]